MAQISSLMIRGSVLLIGLASNVLLARWLGVADFGEYVLLASIVLLPGQALASTNLQLMTRAVGTIPGGGVCFRRLGLGALLAWGLTVVALLVGVLLFAMHRGWLVVDADYRGQFLLICVATALLMAACGTQQGILRGLGLVALSEYPMLVGRTVLGLTVLAVLAAGAWLDVPRALTVQPLTLLLIALFLFWALRRRAEPGRAPGSAPPGANGVHASYLTILSVSSLAPLSAMLGVFGAGALGDRADVANLRVAESLAMLVTLPQVWANVAVSPRFARFWSEQNMGALRGEYLKHAREAFLVAFLVALVVLLAGETLVAVLYGASYAQGLASVLLPLTLGHLFSAYAGSSGQLLIMAGFERWALSSQVLGVVTAVAAMPVLFGEFGLPGIALATSLGIITTNLAARIFVHHRLPVALPLLLFLRNKDAG